MSAMPNESGRIAHERPQGARPAPAAVRLIPAIRAILALLALPYADVAESAGQGEDPDASGDTRLEKIEVVGSRIKRVDLETSQPVFVIERADIERTGLLSVGDVLQQIVFHGDAINTRINNGGDGSVRVSLRNLGPNRTLVLVNGRRWVSTLDGDVDLTQIPLALVERIEVLKDGASAIYGSDAIAGVVNIATRSDYDGAEVGAYYGQWDQGDGTTHAYDVTWGRTGERGSVAAGASYVRQEPVFARDRELTRVGTAGLPPNDCFAGASPTTPNGRFRVPGLPQGPFRFGLTLIDGRPGTSPDDFRLFDPAVDCYNFAPGNYLLTPQERVAAFAQTRYAISESVGFGVDALFNQRRSSQLLAPNPLRINPAFAGLGGNIGISEDNLYNPFGRDIFAFARRFVESGGRLFAQDLDTVRIGAGFDGVFDAWGRSFAWDAHAIHTRNAGTESADGLTDLQAVANALGPSFRDAQGVPRCGTPDAIIAGCVPLNVFGGAGTITPEMAAYIRADSVRRARAEQRGATANVSADLFDLPHGPLGFAAGLEHRREEGADLPSELSLAGRLDLSNQTTRGSFSVDEAYVELVVPILADRPGVRLFDLNAAVRYSDYSNFGSTTNAKFGFRWKPHDDLLLRGNWARGFRAPSIADLFFGRQSGGLGIAELEDPCFAYEGFEPPAADTLARCAALGVPAVFDPNQITNLSMGGNPDLQPETAVTRTLGLVYEPAWLEGFTAYLDWYNVEIADSIGALDAQTIVDRCYVLGESAACERITRAADGHLFTVDATNQNLSSGFETEGFDIGFDWRRDTRLGVFGLRWDTAYVDYYGDRGRPARLTRLPDGTVLQGNAVGGAPFFTQVGAEWRIKSNVVLDWSHGDYGVSLTGRYFSELDEFCGHIVGYAEFTNQPDLRQLCDDPDRVIDFTGDGIGDPAAEHQVDATVFVDLQLRWETPWDGTLQVGINNVLDQDPPVARASFANSFSPAYDIPGRFVYIGFRQRF